MEQALTGWSLSLSCEVSPRCPPSSSSSASSPPVTWQQCNVRRLFSQLANLDPPFPLPPPLSSLCWLARAVQASTCKRRNRDAAPAQDHPHQHRLGPDQGGSISSPVPTLGRPPTGCKTPAKGASSDLMVCLYTWQG